MKDLNEEQLDELKIFGRPLTESTKSCVLLRAPVRLTVTTLIRWLVEAVRVSATEFCSLKKRVVLHSENIPSVKGDDWGNPCDSPFATDCSTCSSEVKYSPLHTASTFTLYTADV